MRHHQTADIHVEDENTLCHSGERPESRKVSVAAKAMRKEEITWVNKILKRRL